LRVFAAINLISQEVGYVEEADGTTQRQMTTTRRSRWLLLIVSQLTCW